MKFLHILFRVLLISLASLLIAGCSSTPPPLPTASLPPTETAPIASPTLTQTQTLTPTSRTVTPTFKSRTKAPTFTPTAKPTQTQTPLFATPLVLENTRVPAPPAAISPQTAGRVVPLAQWGKGSLNDMAYSPDGRLLGVASALGINFYNSQTLEGVSFYPTGQSVTAIRFSPDRTTFACGFADGRIEIRSTADGSVLQTLAIDPNPVFELAYSEDGNQLTSIQDDVNDYQDDGVVYIWDLAQGQMISSKGIERSQLFDLSSNGQMIAQGYEGNGEVYIDLEELTSSKWANRITFDRYEYLYSITLSQDAKQLLTESYQSIAIWKPGQPGSPIVLPDVPSYRQMFYAYSCKIEADGPGSGPLQSAAFSPDGTLLVLGARQGGVQVYRTADGALLASFPGWASQLLFAPGSQTFAMISEEGALEIHRAADGVLLAQTTGLAPFRPVAFSPDNQFLAAGAADNLVRVWRVENGQRALDLQAQANRVAFSPNGSYLASGSDHGALILWNLSSGESRQLAVDSMEQLNIFSVNSLLFTPDGQSLLSGSQACFLESWDLHSGTLNWRVENRTDTEEVWSSNTPVDTVAILPDRQAAATNTSGAIAFYNLKTGEVLAPFNFEKTWWDPGWAFFQPSHDEVVVGDWDSFQVWNLASSAMKYRVDTPVRNLTASPDGQLIATTNNQGIIYLWRSENGELLASLAGHRGEITQLAFSADGRYLASSSADGTIRLWGVQPPIK